MEYTTFAKFYDKFYERKNYVKETVFLKKFLKDKKEILDVGCGTGVHMAILEDNNYYVEGIDINQKMLEIAKQRVKGKLYNQNILKLNINKKYDAIISMFAVINHLKDLDELKIALLNFSKHLNEDGIIVIDLHNSKTSGTKRELIDNITRTMEWKYNEEAKKEITKIIYEIENQLYKTQHKFRIFSIDEIKTTCSSLGLKVVKCYENYTLNNGNDSSKNLQFIIRRI
jgi:2-polyprenyl-3-methyl-5-hydroxy-6-metoxy-1,4-benzoquinol methylase